MADEVRGGARKIGDDAVRKATGRGWDEWFAVLDRFGVKEHGHTKTARRLRENEGASDWWAQSITVRYEWEHGLRPEQQDAER